MDNRQAAQAYAHAMKELDVETLRDLMHQDIVARYPQSGEVFNGRDNYIAMLSKFPDNGPELQSDVSIEGGGDRTIVAPSSIPFAKPTVTVFSGDKYVAEATARYPDGSLWDVVVIVRFSGGKVIEETSYFAEHFDPPDWRAPYRQPPAD